MPNATDLFNASQKICASLFYNLIAQLHGEQRKGAIKALSTLLTSVEEGYILVNDGALRADFFVQCYDSMFGAALALKMAEDDGLVPDLKAIPHTKAVKRTGDAMAALERLEFLMAGSAKHTFSSEH